MLTFLFAESRAATGEEIRLSSKRAEFGNDQSSLDDRFFTAFSLTRFAATRPQS